MKNYKEELKKSGKVIDTVLGVGVAFLIFSFFSLQNRFRKSEERYQAALKKYVWKD